MPNRVAEDPLIQYIEAFYRHGSCTPALEVLKKAMGVPYRQENIDSWERSYERMGARYRGDTMETISNTSPCTGEFVRH